jgi:hypothetical protein
MSRSAHRLPASVRLLTALGVISILIMIALGVAVLVLTAELDDERSQPDPVPAVCREATEVGGDALWRWTEWRDAKNSGDVAEMQRTAGVVIDAQQEFLDLYERCTDLPRIERPGSDAR